jgi:hypothetical protein
LEVLRRALKESQHALEGIRAARKGLQLARAASSVMPKGGCLELDEGLAALGEVFTTAGIVGQRRGNCKSVEIRSLEPRGNQRSTRFRHRRPLDGAEALVPPITGPGSSLHSQFPHDVLDVFFDRPRAEVKDGSDLAVAFAGRDPFEDFAFAQAQRMEG